VKQRSVLRYFCNFSFEAKFSNALHVLLKILRFNRMISGWEVGILHYVRFLLDFFTLKFQKKALSKEVKKSIQDEFLFKI